MTESDKLNDYFVYVIADDDKRKVEMNKMVMSAFGINPVCIEKDFYDNLIEHIYNIHDEGKFPIIFLIILNQVTENETIKKKLFSVLYFFTTKIFKVNPENHFI